jgi:hypothetical protein
MKQEGVRLTLSITNETSFFLGGIAFIIGSVLANISQKGYAFQTAIYFIIGSAFYLMGAAAMFVVNVLKFLDKRAKKESPQLEDFLRLAHSVLNTVGGILFTVGASVFILNTPKYIFIAEVIWNIGSALFLFGTTFTLLADQINLSVLYEEGDPTRSKKRKAWLKVLGADWYVVGTILFSIGSAVFLINTPTSNVIGNTVWILGSVCFLFGSTSKFAAEFS